MKVFDFIEKILESLSHHHKMFEQMKWPHYFKTNFCTKSALKIFCANCDTFWGKLYVKKMKEGFVKKKDKFLRAVISYVKRQS